MSTKMTLKHAQDEAGGKVLGWFHLYRECYEEDEGLSIWSWGESDLKRLPPLIFPEMA